MQGPLSGTMLPLHDVPRPWFGRLLLRHLPPHDRLKLFRTSKSLAAAVMSCSNHIELKLGAVMQCTVKQQQARGLLLRSILAWGTEDTSIAKPEGSREAIAGTICGCFHMWHTVQPSCSVDCDILKVRNAIPKPTTVTFTFQPPLTSSSSRISKLHVKLHASQLDRGAPAWSALPHHQITRITLLGFQEVTLRTLSSLALQRCVRLKHLTVGRGGLLQQQQQQQRQWQRQATDSTSSYEGMVRLSPEGARYVPASLNSLRLESCTLECAYPVLQALSHQLTHLINNISHLQLVPHTLTHLTHYVGEAELTDKLLERLSKLPQLAHVTVDGLQLQEAHHSMQLHWQQLQLTSGASVLGLLQLPLHAIRHVVIHGELYCVGGVATPTGSVQWVVEHLSRCQHLHCVPQRLADLNGQHTFSFSGVFVPAIINLCIQSITSPCVVRLCGFRPSVLPHLLPCLRQLPVHITQLLLCNQETPDSNLLSETPSSEHWQIFFAALPAHIATILIRVDCLVSWCSHLLALNRALRTVASDDVLQSTAAMAYILLHRTQHVPHALCQMVQVPHSRMLFVILD